VKLRSFVYLMIFLMICAVNLYIFFDKKNDTGEYFVFLKHHIYSVLLNERYTFPLVLQKGDIDELKLLLDKDYYSHDLIKGIEVIKNGKVVMFADSHKFKENKKIEIPLRELKKIDNFRLFEPLQVYTEFSVYKNGEKTYKIIMQIDEEKLKQMVFDSLYELEFVLFFGALFYLVFIFFILRKFFLKPFEELTYIAKNKEIVSTKKFFIKELNDIKEALLKSFIDLKRSIKEIKKSKLIDDLTKTGNKYLLFEYARPYLEKHKKAALLYIDIDNFKEINDFYGHHTGDEILKKFAGFLKKTVGYRGFVVRYSGDEFIVLFSYHNRAEVENLIRKIFEAVNGGKLSYENIFYTVSIGAAFYPEDAENIYDLLKKAELTLFHVKDTKKNSYKFYTSEIQEEFEKELEIATMLKEAVKNDEFELFFQPVVNKNGKIVGCESLIRWFRDGKMISPGIFIPIAEKRGLIWDIGEIVIKKAFSAQREWQKTPLKDITVNFNISAIQVKNNKICSTVKYYLNRTKADAGKLEIEITETAYMENFEKLKKFMGEMKKTGFKFALDDFGTGYSSLSMLTHSAFDVVKIDKAFVDALDTKEGEHFIKSIIYITRGLGMKTVAEGVEHEWQFEKLKSFGIDYYQGFYFYKPMPKEEFEKTVMENLSKFGS